MLTVPRYVDLDEVDTVEMDDEAVVSVVVAADEFVAVVEEPEAIEVWKSAAADFPPPDTGAPLLLIMLVVTAMLPFPLWEANVITAICPLPENAVVLMMPILIVLDAKLGLAANIARPETRVP